MVLKSAAKTEIESNTVCADVMTQSEKINIVLAFNGIFTRRLTLPGHVTQNGPIYLKT